MKKITVVLVVILLASIFAVGQEEKAQVFGGYQLTSLGTPGGRTTFPAGWNADLALKATKNISFVGDFSGAYKSESATVAGISANEEAKDHTFLFGPRFSAKAGKLTPFAEALVGFSHLSGSRSVDGFNVGSGSTNAFALAFGGGLDVTASKHVAVRLAKFDYILNREDGTNLNNFRIATGLVYKF